MNITNDLVEAINALDIVERVAIIAAAAQASADGSAMSIASSLLFASECCVQEHPALRTALARVMVQRANLLDPDVVAAPAVHS